MKKIIEIILFAIITLTGGILATSCDSCETVVCTNGYCNNETCICNDGYEKINRECTSINHRYAGEDMLGIQIKEGHWTGPPDTQTVTYTIITSDLDPTQIILKNFNNFVGHDIHFTVNELNRNELIETETLTTGPIPAIYKASGSKNDNQIKLTVQDYTLGSLAFPAFHITLSQ